MPKSHGNYPHGHCITFGGRGSKGEIRDGHAGGAFAGARGQFGRGLFKEAQDQIKTAGVGGFGGVDAIIKHQTRRSIDQLFLEFNGSDGGGKLGSQVVESQRQRGGGLSDGWVHVSLLNKSNVMDEC